MHHVWKKSTNDGIYFAGLPGIPGFRDSLESRGIWTWTWGSERLETWWRFSPQSETKWFVPNKNRRKSRSKNTWGWRKTFETNCSDCCLKKLQDQRLLNESELERQGVRQERRLSREDLPLKKCRYSSILLFEMTNLIDSFIGFRLVRHISTYIICITFVYTFGSGHEAPMQAHKPRHTWTQRDSQQHSFCTVFQMVIFFRPGPSIQEAKESRMVEEAMKIATSAYVGGIVKDDQKALLEAGLKLLTQWHGENPLNGKGHNKKGWNWRDQPLFGQKLKKLTIFGANVMGILKLFLRKTSSLGQKSDRQDETVKQILNDPQVKRAMILMHQDYDRFFEDFQSNSRLQAAALTKIAMIWTYEACWKMVGWRYCGLIDVCQWICIIYRYQRRSNNLHNQHPPSFWSYAFWEVYLKQLLDVGLVLFLAYLRWYTQSTGNSFGLELFQHSRTCSMTLRNNCSWKLLCSLFHSLAVS